MTATSSPRPRQAVLVLSLAIGIFVGCADGDGAKGAQRPPLGRWHLIEFDGEIRSQFGGRPVLCLQGSLQRRPAPLYTGPSEVRSWLELRPEGDLGFAFYFEDSSTYDVLSTDPQLPAEGFLDDAFGRDQPRTSGSWNWPEKSVEGTVETVPALEGAAEHRARFTMQGVFEAPGQIAGEWTFQTSSESGGCWGRAMGKGEFRAAPAAE